MVSTSSAELIRCSGLFRIRSSERKSCLRESKLTGEDSAKFASSRSPVRRSFSKCGCVYGKPVFRRNKDVSLRRDFDSGGCVLDELPRTATKNSECEKARCAWETVGSWLVGSHGNCVYTIEFGAPRWTSQVQQVRRNLRRRRRRRKTITNTVAEVSMWWSVDVMMW